MSWKPTFWLLAMALLAGFFVLVFERNPESVARSLPIEPPVLHLDPSAVTRLSVAVGKVSVDCVRRGGEWFLTHPVEMRADSARVGRLIAALGTIRKHESVDPIRQGKRGLTLASFGLDSPRARFVVGTELRADEILLGDTAPLGDSVYILLNGDSTVIGATCRLPDIFPVDLDGLRDRAVFPARIRGAVRVELKHAGGFVQLAFRDGVWHIQQPFDARADGARVERLLQSLGALMIQGPGGEVASVEPAAYGLGAEDAVLQVSVWPDGRREPLTLTVGKPRADNPDWLYAKISDMASIGAVDKTVLSLQAITAESVRDRRLCDADPAVITSVTLREGDSKLVMEKTVEGGWMIMEPLRSVANPRAVGTLLKIVCGLQVEGVLAEAPASGESLPCRLMLANGPPGQVVTNAAAGPSVPGKVFNYRFAKPGSEATQAPVFAEETKTFYRVNSMDLARLWGKTPGRDRLVLSDPLVYMDCQMLNINPQEVRRITLTRQNREETVTVGADGLWGVDSPPDGQVAEGAIPVLLRLASNLQAERIEGMATTNTSAFGLAESATRITFGLSGDTGIQKTILIGDDNGQDGLYSMVQGQDMVFVLKKDIADALMRPLVTTP